MQPKKRSNGKTKSELELLAFKIDAETRAMLDDLCADLEARASAEGDVFRGRAQAIRKAIRFAHGSRPWRLPT